MESRAEDIQRILAKQHVNGGEYWATPEGIIEKGSPFSTLECGIMLYELQYDPQSKEVKGIVDLIFKNMRDDGRFKVFKSGAIYPCHTANAVKTLCYLGYSEDKKLEKTYSHLLATQHTDGGWRCNSCKFGKGPETAFSNPGPTLTVLDVFRFTPYVNKEENLDKAVEFLLRHWETRAPLGPCHYGIGKLFMQIEYPMFRYNIFYYVYVLSFYDKAKKDPRFREAFEVLRKKAIENEIKVENPNKKLESYNMCRKMRISELATKRYIEILKNIDAL